MQQSASYTVRLTIHLPSTSLSTTMTTQVANPTTTGVTVSAPPRGPLGPRPAATLYSTADGKVGVTSAGVQQPNNAAVTTTATTTSTVAVPVTQQANGNPALSSSPLSPGIMTGRPTFQRDDAHHASLFIGDLGPEVSSCGRGGRACDAIGELTRTLAAPMYAHRSTMLLFDLPLIAFLL